MKTMKKYDSIKQLMIGLSILTSMTLLNAQGPDGHSDHDTEMKATSELKAGHNGGRLVTTVKPHVEFFLKKDRTVQITFLDESGAIVSPAEQTVSVIGGDRSAPTTLKFKQEGNVLVSEQALPEGKNLPIILQIKVTPESKTIRERFYLNLSECSGCGYAEYACTCGH